jgi:mRNA-degrading endonuclease toxin of MazEF toxin-antitoxin module
MATGQAMPRSILLTDDVIVVPIFTTGRLGPTRVAITAGSGGTADDSVLFCEELTTIDRDFLQQGPLGPPVPASVLETIVRSIRRAMGEVVL